MPAVPNREYVVNLAYAAGSAVSARRRREAPSPL